MIAEPALSKVKVPPRNASDLTEVMFVIDVIVAPRETELDPSVTEEFANWLLGIALVPNSPGDAS